MAGGYKFTTTFERKSGIPADRVVNGWYFAWNAVADPGSSDFDVVANALEQFFSVAPSLGGGETVGAYMGEQLDRSAGMAVNAYELPATPGPLGAPVYTNTMVFSAAHAGTAFPAEIAVCLSFRSDYGSAVEFDPGAPGPGDETRPRARHRGRIYLGPIQAGSSVDFENASTSEIEVSSGMRDRITDAAQESLSAGLASSPLNGTDWTWIQWSNTDWAGAAVTSCWVDNAWDVQRRRGNAPTTRTTAAITP